MNPAPGEFVGTARFRPLGRLGAGGMGIVYRALDRERGVEVALKTLSNVSAATIFRFKQEFRALADVAHPNLVTLHELFCEDGRWFFTMELVDGIDLLTYVCGQAVGGSGAGDGPSLATLVDTGAPEPGEKPRRGRPLIARLRQTLPQLVAGLCALHDGGHLHHDVKPSNVLVTPDGRVVVLDFGVITEIGAYNEAGTPAYMAPEHARAAPATPASDWYSVGVILYEALAGLRPFTGSHVQIIWDKAHGEPVSPRLVRPDTPADLDRLCCDLLRMRPEDRPSGRDILGRLGAHDRRGRQQVAVPVTSEPALVGRDAHLRALRDAFARSRDSSVVALVHGASGTGKSALVRAFGDAVRRDADALVFAGRCYERESVPYKAIDTVIDALCEHLLALPEPERAALLPRDAALLATLFPVLHRLPALADVAAPELANRPHRLRQRAFAALRQLLARLAAQRPLVIVIDDLQWGDADSAPLLEALLRAPGAPALLLAGCYRDDEAKRSPLLQAWLPADVTDIAVGALAPDDALAIATAAFRAEGADDALAGAVALESGGNPFFLHELVRFVAAARSEQIPSLDDVIRARIARVGGEARRLIDVLAVAGRPVEQRVAQHAAEIDDAEWPVLVQHVGAARIVRVSGRRGDDYIEAYHDRIHEAALATLARDAAAHIHRRLALALQSATHRDPEMIARHFEAAGDATSAARYALRAAESAAAALAFDRAVALYRRAFALGADVRLALAGALVNAGRGAEAAQLYLEAAGESTGAPAIELRRLAAEQLLRSGHVDAGLVVLADVLRAVGMTLPVSAARSIPSLAWRRTRLRLRGLAPAARADASPELLARLDATRTATLGLALFDPVRAATFSTQHVRLALATGDEQRIAFALALEAGYNASARKQRRALDLLARADTIATATQHPLLLGAVGVIRAIASYSRGEFRAAFDACERVEGLIHEHLTGTAWELRTVQLFALHSLFFLGDFRELTRRTALYVADARERGDRYAIMNIRTLAANLGHVVMRDDVATAKAELADVAAELPASGFYLQHVFLCYAHALFDLYAGDGERAYRELAAWHPRVKASLLLHDRSVRMFWCYLRGAAAAATGRPREARRAARALAADGARPYLAMAHQLRAAATPDPERAADELFIAMNVFQHCGMRLYGLFTARRRAQLLGNSEHVRHYDEQAREQLVAVPAHAARCLAPGFPDG